MNNDAEPVPYLKDIPTLATALKMIAEEKAAKAEKNRKHKRAVKVWISSLSVGALCAWQLMFALALFGFPRFGFLELWLAVDAVAGIVAIGVTSGISAYQIKDDK